MADYERIRGNVSKMIDMGAPEADVDAYLSEEGVTPDQLRSYGQQRGATPSPSEPPAPIDTGGHLATTPEDGWTPYDEPVKKVDIPASTAPQDNFGVPGNKSGGPGFATRQLGAVNEGIASLVGAPVDLANMGLGAIGLPTSDKPFLGSESIKDGMHSIGVGRVDESYAPQSALERYTQAAAEMAGNSVLPVAGTLAKGGQLLNKAAPFVSNGGSTLLAKLGDAASKGGRELAEQAALRPGTVVATEAASALGAGVGGQAARDIAPGNPYAEFAGTMIGGLAVPAAPKLPKAARNYRDNRFVQTQKTQNPYAAYDAEIVDDLNSVLTKTAKTKLDPKGRAVVTAKEINNLEQGWQARYKDMINALDIPADRKLELKKVLDQDYTGDLSAVEKLRGTPEGDAVYHAVVKTQRLRALTPELKKNGFLKGAVEFGSTVGAGLAAGPVAAPVGYGAAKYFLRRMVDGESARVNAAERLLKRKGAYEKLAERVGPSGQRESQKALEDVYSSTVRGKEAARTQQAAERVRKAQDEAALATENKRVSINNDRDNIKPGGGFRGRIYEQTGLLPRDQDIGALQLLAKGAITKRNLDHFLKDPNKLQKGNAGNAIIDRLASMADEGLLQRDPHWKSPPAEPLTPTAVKGPVDANGMPIVNEIAYRAEATGKQTRVTEGVKGIQSEPKFNDDQKGLVGAAATRIGTTGNRDLAETILMETLKSVPPELQVTVAKYLRPLVEQIKRPRKPKD